MYPAKMNHRTGGQFGAQRILCKVVNHGTGGSTKKIILLACFHPHDPTDHLFKGFTELIEDLYIMSNH
ncbi:hypothetical protein MJO28_011417 [Puccinia striiformis f. sp. tritici]|uniref:Uncharacterized protein n=1 Tax=Puccinia striiformis f. sp. tritici TaxID=168172 RepID=A0ACC0E218_9BASI|nr:hypothetical protein MJO28_011417 [Puccinia striiformis f. sp. tritici]